MLSRRMFEPSTKKKEGIRDTAEHQDRTSPLFPERGQRGGLGFASPGRPEPLGYK